jgi:hypothetical protein
MSRVVKVYNSNYKVAVQPGGTITLDTGDISGTTVITGNLEVKGTTTSVDSTTVTIADNIITLSEGTTGNGLPASVGYVSGLEIDRGDYLKARWLFDEQVFWQLGGTDGFGTFAASFADGQKLPINTPGIVSNGNLYVQTGSGVISVTNTNNYEEKVFTYTNSVITPDQDGNVVVDDDHIPNAKSVKDYVEYVFANEFYDTIAKGDSSVEVIDEIHTLNSVVSIVVSGNQTIISTVGQHGFTTADTVDISGVLANGDAIENLNGNGIQITQIVSTTSFKVNVNTTGGNVANYVSNSGTVNKTGAVEGRIKVTVEGINNTNFFSNRVELEDIRIEGSEIYTTSSNQDLTISAPGTGTIKINDVLELPSSPHTDDISLNPIVPISGTKIYSKPEGSGQTGLYYVNSNNTQDEFIGRNRALLFSLIF